jgi:hypothetical protein
MKRVWQGMCLSVRDGKIQETLDNIMRFPNRMKNPKVDGHHITIDTTLSPDHFQCGSWKDLVGCATPTETMPAWTAKKE